MESAFSCREVMAGLSVECSIQACTIRRPTIGLRSMIFRLSSISRILAVLILIVAVVPAQRGEVGGEQLTAEQQKAMRMLRAKGDKPQEAGEADSEAAARWEAMSPEERLAANIRRGSKAHCRFVAACRPPKLLPGQSGVLMITAILQGQAVLPAPLQLKMTPRVKVGSVSLGALAAHPALPGTMAKAYINRPVYENTAVFEVPVTMGNDAKLGQKTPLAVDLEFDLYDGKSGQAIGRFIERVSADVEIAPHVDPEVAGRANKPKVTPKPVVAVEPVNKQSSQEDATKPDGNAMGGKATEVPVAGAKPAEVVEPATSGDLPPTETGGIGMPYMLVIGGGAFLLVIALLLMRKK